MGLTVIGNWHANPLKDYAVEIAASLEIFWELVMDDVYGNTRQLGHTIALQMLLPQQEDWHPRPLPRAYHSNSRHL